MSQKKSKLGTPAEKKATVKETKETTYRFTFSDIMVSNIVHCLGKAPYECGEMISNIVNTMEVQYKAQKPKTKKE